MPADVVWACWDMKKFLSAKMKQEAGLGHGYAVKSDTFHHGISDVAASEVS